MPVRIAVATASAPGAVAIIQLVGAESTDVLAQLTGRRDWQTGRVQRVRFPGIDDGVAIQLHDCVQLMPHGGPRGVQRLLDELVRLGCTHKRMSSRELYPEATSDLEADMLDALARAASPAAIDLLLKQPENWRQWIERQRAGLVGSQQDTAAILDRSGVLDRLIHPPSMVVIGRPNVGKSTLTNRMLGRAASIVADVPGTTRDWVAGLAELPTAHGNIAVRWMDTPGLRHSDDPVEQQAICAANEIIRQADVLIAMRDPIINWPDAAALPRQPDLWVMNKIDLVPSPAALREDVAAVHAISAGTGAGVESLIGEIAIKLNLNNLDPSQTWAFSPRLRELVSQADLPGLQAYSGW